MLKDKLRKHVLVLASRSPRRMKLLQEAGIPFRLAIPLDIEEKFPKGLDKFQIAVYLAELKSEAFGEIPDNEILLTADTIVWFENEVINKPANRENAIEILTALSGKMHEVITGVCLRKNFKTKSFYSHSEVHFAKLSTEEITHYVDTWKPFDKAGGYGIQEWIGYIGIEKINGSYFNVMGLPIQKLYRELEKFID
ncbi:MAG: septum formation protein Maf [Bacteroidales bacterium]|nr:septum formation protein Maf [Bacteroidales bacterium]MCB9013815.1 septum formation protein Maf [Bacteroidales bacterium]